MIQYTIEMWRLAVKRGGTELGFEEWQKDCAEKAAALASAEAQKETFLVRINKPQLAAILAGLNWMHSRVACDPQLKSITEDLKEIITDGGSFTHLSAKAIDDLIVGLNEGTLTPSTVAYLYLRKDGKVATIGIHKPGPRCKLDIKELVMK